MATKTISLEVDAYEKLRRAKRNGRESFSSVVRRAHWDEAQPTAGEIVDGLREAVRAHPEMLLPDKDLARVARRRRTARRRTHWESA